MICVWRETLFRKESAASGRGWGVGRKRVEKPKMRKKHEKSGVFSDHTRLALSAASNSTPSPAPRMQPN